MPTIAHTDEMARASELEEAVRVEVDGGTIEGVLWALVIMIPIYATIAWVLMS